MPRTSRYFKNTSVRTQLGITQENYVSYLMGNRSMLAMYENNKRSLPHEAFMRNGAVELSLARPETAVATEAAEQEQRAAAIQVLTRRRAICSATITKLQIQLTKMKEKYQHCLNLVRVGITAPTILLEIYPQNDRYEKDKANLENFGRCGKDDMEYCGIGQQQLLQLKIEALQFEVDRIGDMIKG